jgi:hypothetical protein
MNIALRFACLAVTLSWCVAAFAAEAITRSQVLDAIAVLEKDVTAEAAPEAAAKVARFGEESPSVLIIIGDETMPWMADQAPAAEAAVRAMLTAAYFAGNIKAQLERRHAQDDPYAGWLFLFNAYKQMRKKQPALRIPEIEALQEQEKAGVLKKRADDIRRRDEERERQSKVAAARGNGRPAAPA